MHILAAGDVTYFLLEEPLIDEERYSIGTCTGACLELCHELGREQGGGRGYELAQLDVGGTQPLKQPPQHHLHSAGVEQR